MGSNLKLGDYSESATETQNLIDDRPDIQHRMETFGRGVAAVKTGSSVFVSWRWLSTESIDVRYNVYRNGEKLNSQMEQHGTARYLEIVKETLLKDILLL